MKRTAAILLLLALLAALGACGAKPAAPGKTASSEPTYRIGVAVYRFDDVFMTQYRAELESYFAQKETDEAKYDLTFYDAKNDPQVQQEQLRQMLSDGTDLIILNLVRTTDAESVISEITGKGVPLVLINREPCSGDGVPFSALPTLPEGKYCYVGADARQSGRFQGEILLAQPDHGDVNGDGVVSYIMLEGDPENVDARHRTEQSVAALTDAGYTVECLFDEVGNWEKEKGKQLCLTALRQYGDKAEVIFCNNDAMAIGAAEALAEQGRTVGRDVYLLGVDGLAECQKMVELGTMTGTVLNDHIGQSHAAADVAVRLLHGESVEPFYWVDYVKVMR